VVSFVLCFWYPFVLLSKQCGPCPHQNPEGCQREVTLLQSLHADQTRTLAQVLRPMPRLLIADQFATLWILKYLPDASIRPGTTLAWSCDGLPQFDNRRFGHFIWRHQTGTRGIDRSQILVDAVAQVRDAPGNTLHRRARVSTRGRMCVTAFTTMTV
jgi:hypothetical protein